MAIGKKTGGRNFEKGNTISKLGGRPRDSEEVKKIKATIKEIKKPEFKALLQKFIAMSYEELDAFRTKGTALEMMLAKQVRDAIDRGETPKLEYFTDRLFGKAPDILHVDASHEIEGELKVKLTTEVRKARESFDDEF
jgi:hypothetical protein